MTVLDPASFILGALAGAIVLGSVWILDMKRYRDNNQKHFENRIREIEGGKTC